MPDGHKRHADYCSCFSLFLFYSLWNCASLLNARLLLRTLRFRSSFLLHNNFVICFGNKIFIPQVSIVVIKYKRSCTLRDNGS